MGKYGDAAIKAAKYVQMGQDPLDAWNKACDEIFEEGSASRSKGCPKGAFLGLYGGKGKNAEYARKASEYLKDNPGDNISQKDLWEIVTNGTPKNHNGQMDVLLSLFREELI